MNRAVVAVEVGGGMAPIAGQRSTVAVSTAGETEEDADTTDGGRADVRLVIDGRLMAAATTRPGAVALLSLPARPAGVLTGSVEIDADALHADDRRFFAARVEPPPAVALSGGEPFIADALDVLAEAGRIRRVSGDSDVAILPGAEGASARGARTALIILPPVSPTELNAVNRRLADAGVGWRYEAPTAGEARFAAEQSDPLLRALPDARVRQLYPLVRNGGTDADSVLIRLEDGSPWAVRGTRSNGGTYVLLGSPMTAEASTLPTSAVMLPLLDRLTGAWSLSDAPRTDAVPGQEIALASGTRIVERPDGTRDDVTGATSYRFGGEPGVYRVLRGDSTLAAFAVNPPAAESDLSRLEESDMETLLPGWTVHGTTSDGAWRRAVFRERLGRELWRPLLIALLLVLAAETLLAASGRVRRARAPTAGAEGIQAEPVRLPRPIPGPPELTQADASISHRRHAQTAGVHGNAGAAARADRRADTGQSARLRAIAPGGGAGARSEAAHLGGGGSQSRRRGGRGRRPALDRRRRTSSRSFRSARRCRTRRPSTTSR
jgi:hypothetical protein